MTGERKPVLTGGCQCGAVRYAVFAEKPRRIGLCHCRMCQKAVAGPFISLADVSHEDFVWTRGRPASFRSSTIAERDFCAACGTPLSYRQLGGPHIELTTGSFDQAHRVVPTYSTGTESQLAWTRSIADFPGRPSSEPDAATHRRIISYQHPDQET